MNTRPSPHQLSLLPSDATEITERLTRYRLELVEEDSAARLPASALDRPEPAAEWCSHQLSNRPSEHMLALYLTTRQTAIGWAIVSIGTLNRAAVEPRPILQMGLALNAAGFILSHNHPSGDPSPSPEDLAFTRRMHEAGDIVGVRLVDHIVIGSPGRWVSLRQRGAF